MSEQENKKDLELIKALEQRYKELKESKGKEQWSEDRDVRRQIWRRKSWS